jgi:hypothetical protein
LASSSQVKYPTFCFSSTSRNKRQSISSTELKISSNPPDPWNSEGTNLSGAPKSFPCDHGIRKDATRLRMASSKPEGYR